MARTNLQGTEGSRQGRPKTPWPFFLLLWGLSGDTLSAQAGALFSQPFVVEHHLVQRDGDGSVYHGAKVTDYYGGSWIVSVRADQSRMVVDLARRELTEIRPRAGTYWTLTFDRLAELRDRYLATGLGQEEAALVPPATRPTSLVAQATAPPAEPEVVVTAAPRISRPGALSALPEASAELLQGAGVQRLRVALRSDPPERRRLEVWVDPRVRLGGRAQEALVGLERALGPSSPNTQEVTPGRLMAAARRHAGGAFPVRTVRPLVGPGGPVPGGTLEDVTTRLEPLASFPAELVKVPEGLRQVAHPLELVLAMAEDETDGEALIGNPLKP